jgi:L-arabinose isomerase
VALATPTRLAGYLQQDLDTYTANLVLDNASDVFEIEADTKFSSTSAVYTLEGYGQDVISLPRQPVIAVQSVTVDGLAVTDYQKRGANLYRILRWGGTSSYAADVVVTYTYGYTTVPGSVELAVLQLAAELYERPVSSISSEQIDDYVVRYDGTPVPRLAISWRDIAARYRVGAVA